MMRMIWLVGLVLLPLTGVDGQVVATPEGTVEFIGLDRWTVSMIEDTMAVHAPDEPLGQCAAVLQQVGFPAASASHYRDADGTAHILVTVVEPHLADRIQPRVAFPDSVPDRSGWAFAHEFFRSENRAFQRAVQLRGVFLEADQDIRSELLSFIGPDTLEVGRYWDFLEEHRDPDVLVIALWTLENDRNWRNRIIAATLLTSFPNDDLVWHALLAAQRDSYAPVAGTAAQALRSLMAQGSREVDWAGATDTIRALLLGTNVFHYRNTLDVLRQTGIDSRLAPDLLREGGADLLLAHLAATHPEPREAARGFLAQISGKDLGSDRSAWEEWLALLD
jgi:hypothetical protein